jgi:hypothetical protein
MPQARPEHRPRHPLHSVKVRLSHLQAKWRCGYYDDDVRISLSRMRRPTSGRDVWVPNYTWDLPKSDLTVDEARALLQRLNAEAKRVYQAEKQQEAERKRRALLRHREHEEPELPGELKTAPHPNGGTMNWIE